MGIQLEWDIESEKSKLKNHREDPAVQRARRRALVRLVMLIVFLAALGLAAYWLINKRLEQIDALVEHQLRNTIEAEIAALRIGDLNAYLGFQRSATQDWFLQQEQQFDQLQALKIASDLQLTGSVSDIAIDGQRARAQVGLVVDGVPYVWTWFYWLYDDEQREEREIPGGWYHVPPDFTFWGEEQQRSGSQYTLRYRGVDAPVAQAMSIQLDAWFAMGCEIVTCETLPPVTVDIVANGLPESLWAETGSDGWQMIVPSPYVRQARQDRPFSPQMQAQVAQLLASRLVDAALPALPQSQLSDAAYVRSAVTSWLVGRFLQLDTGAHLVRSLVGAYGSTAVADLLNWMQPYSDIAELAVVTGVADLSQAPLDWRDYLRHRLNQENLLIQQGEQDKWLQMIDTRLPDVRDAAYARYNNPVDLRYEVLSVEQAQAADGTPQLRALVQIAEGDSLRQDYVTFTLVNNRWLRAG